LGVEDVVQLLKQLQAASLTLNPRHKAFLASPEGRAAKEWVDDLRRRLTGPEAQRVLAMLEALEAPTLVDAAPPPPDFKPRPTMGFKPDKTSKR
jgi:hypothetical protein